MSSPLPPEVHQRSTAADIRSDLQRIRDKLEAVKASGAEDGQSHDHEKSAEEGQRLLLAKDIPVKAGSSNSNPARAEGVRQSPTMEALPSDDGFHTARGGDTLDAFCPLAYIAQQSLVPS